MKKVKFIVAIALMATMLVSVTPAYAEPSTAPFVIVFNQGKAPADVAGLVSAAGGELLFWFPEVGLAVANGDPATFADAVKGHSSVLNVGPTGMWTLPETVLYTPEFDAPTATDALYPAYQWNIRRVGADQAWAAGVTGSHDTVVAVIDTGIDATHPDLAPNVVFQACMQLAGPCAADTVTYYHGTHVAGTVAAAFDGGGVVGVGPNLGLAGYQVFEDGGDGAYDGPIWWAIIDAANRGYEVINMSLGGAYQFPYTNGDGGAVWTAWNRVVNYAVQNGTTVVASAGNSEFNANGPVYHIPSDLSGVISVAATGIQPDPVFPQAGAYDIRAFYSNYGAAIDISAPGGDCGEVGSCSGAPPSGFPYHWYLVLSTTPGGYGWAGGTSMASPHVAAAAGLIMDQNPDLNPHQVRAILTQTADKVGSRQLFGHGMLDVLEAVTVAGGK